MTQTQENNVLENLFSFSSIENIRFRSTEENTVNAATACTPGKNEGVMELPVNNYLKTPDEIELEFRYGINPGRLNLRKDNLHDVASIMKTDGYLNIHSLDKALSGFMEENY